MRADSSDGNRYWRRHFTITMEVNICKTVYGVRQTKTLLRIVTNWCTKHLEMMLLGRAARLQLELKQQRRNLSLGMDILRARAEPKPQAASPQIARG